MTLSRSLLLAASALALGLALGAAPVHLPVRPAFAGSAAAEPATAEPATAAPKTETTAAASQGTVQPAEPVPADDAIVARVDGEPVTGRDLRIAAEDLGDRLPRVPEAQRRDYLISYVIDLKLGAKATAQSKLAEDPDFVTKLAFARDRLLLEEYIAAEARKAVTPEAARKLYDETIKDLKPEPEVHARHILVPTEEEARKAYERVKGGEDFAKVATELSKDPGSGKEGGDLGWFTKERMVPEFAEASFKLEPGQISQPVKTQFGWHVIKVEEKRTRPVPAFDEVKEEVESYLSRKAQQEAMLALRARAKIEKVADPKASDPKSPDPKAPTGSAVTPSGSDGAAPKKP